MGTALSRSVPTDRTYRQPQKQPSHQHGRGSGVWPGSRAWSVQARVRMRAPTHTDLGPFRFPRQTDLNELRSRLPSFLKVLLTVLLLHLECQPGPQDALQGQSGCDVGRSRALPAPHPHAQEPSGSTEQSRQGVRKAFSSLSGFSGAWTSGGPASATALCPFLPTATFEPWDPLTGRRSACPTRRVTPLWKETPRIGAAPDRVREAVTGSSKHHLLQLPLVL